LCPDEVISVNGVDIVCVGEGELPMIDLCNALEKGEDFSKIKSLWGKKRGMGLNKIIKNELMPLVEDLDVFPFPDREFCNYNDLLLNHSYEGYEQEAAVKKGRGCAFKCAYCSNATLRNLYSDKGSYVRSRSVENVISELRYLKESFPSISVYLLKSHHVCA